MSSTTQFTNSNSVKISDVLEKMNTQEGLESEFLPNPLDSKISIDPKTKFLADSLGYETKIGSVSEIFEEIERMSISNPHEMTSDMTKFHKMMRENLNSKDSINDLSEKLFRAAGKGDIDFVSELVFHPRFSEFMDITDDSGFTAVSYAITYGNPHIAKLLVDHGAKPDESLIGDFINLGDIDPELLKESVSSSKDVTKEDIEALHQEILNPSDDLPNCGFIKPPRLDSSDKIEAIRRSVQETNNFETAFRRNAKLVGMFDEKDEPLDEVIVEPLDEVIVKPKKKSSKKTNGFGSSFAANMKKNFKKVGYSEGREQVKIEIPQREETTPAQMEEIINQFERNQMKQSSYSAVNNRFVEEFSSRNVSLLLVQTSNISPEIQEYRNQMLPNVLPKEKLFKLVKNVMLKQISNMKTKKIQTCVDEIYDIALFYRDMFSRLIDLKKAYVKKSRIHGNGVFVSSNMKRGDIITFYFPYFIEYIYEDEENKKEAFTVVPIISRREFNSNTDELDNLRRGTIRMSNTMMMVGDDQYYGDNRFLGHIVNDPCDFTSEIVTTVEYERQITEKANAALIRYDKDSRFIYLVATKDINKDSEVLVPYGCRYWEISETP